MDKIVIVRELEQVSEPWRPRVVAELNGQEVKIARFRGTFVWHRHEHADEMFLGVSGRYSVEFRDRTVELGPGELLVVPRGVEHRTTSAEGAEVMIFEPAGTCKTGDE